MTLVKVNARNSLDALVYDNEYTALAEKIELMHEQLRKLNSAETEKSLSVNRIKEIEEYFAEQETSLNKFDEELFRKLVEKVKICSMVEVMFVFKSGVEVIGILE